MTPHAMSTTGVRCLGALLVAEFLILGVSSLHTGPGYLRMLNDFGALPPPLGLRIVSSGWWLASWWTLLGGAALWSLWWKRARARTVLGTTIGMAALACGFALWTTYSPPIWSCPVGPIR